LHTSHRPRSSVTIFELSSEIMNTRGMIFYLLHAVFGLTEDLGLDDFVP
jgi:hypothetical protein